MQLMDILKQTGGIEAIAGQLGLSPSVAQAGAEALLPAILGGFSKQDAPVAASSSGGLGAILEQLGGSGLAANVLGTEPTNVGQGNDVLGQIFGSKDVSRTVAGHAAGKTGIDPAMLKKMLPILAMLVTGYLSQGQSGGQSSQGGGLGSILGSIMGGGKSSSQSQGGILGGLGSMLDFDGDGNPLDDIIGMAGKFIR